MTKPLKKPGTICRHTISPMIKAAIFKLHNINPNNINRVQKIKHMLSFKRMLGNEKVLKSKTPLRLRFSNLTSRDCVDTLSIAALMPKEMPNNLGNLLDNRIMNG